MKGRTLALIAIVLIIVVAGGAAWIMKSQQEQKAKQKISLNIEGSKVTPVGGGSYEVKIVIKNTYTETIVVRRVYFHKDSMVFVRMYSFSTDKSNPYNIWQTGNGGVDWAPLTNVQSKSISGTYTVKDGQLVLKPGDSVTLIWRARWGPFNVGKQYDMRIELSQPPYQELKYKIPCTST